MIKKLAKQIYREKGFTLIELLVVVAILGILAAIAIPNVSKFISSGKSEAANTELHNVQLAVAAAMADQQIGTIKSGKLSSKKDLDVGDTTAGAFIIGGHTSLVGTYKVEKDGEVTLKAYPGLLP